MSETTSYQRSVGIKEPPHPTHSRSAKEIQGVLTRFLSEPADPYEFDDFISTPLDDPSLEAIRTRCNSLPVEFPPEHPGNYCGQGGAEVIRRFIAELSEPENRT
jgi:hypothetical protein